MRSAVVGAFRDGSGGGGEGGLWLAAYRQLGRSEAGWMGLRNDGGEGVGWGGGLGGEGGLTTMTISRANANR